jgi:hypothetical protein
MDIFQPGFIRRCLESGIIPKYENADGNITSKLIYGPRLGYIGVILTIAYYDL